MTIYIILSIGLSFLIAVINYILAPKLTYSEKVSAYECGFEPYSGTRNLFDIHFYLVSILFIIFDLEITFLFPGAAFFSNIKNIGFIAMLLFLIILTVGLYYEGNLNALRGKLYSV